MSVNGSANAVVALGADSTGTEPVATAGAAVDVSPSSRRSSGSSSSDSELASNVGPTHYYQAESLQPVEQRAKVAAQAAAAAATAVAAATSRAVELEQQPDTHALAAAVTAAAAAAINLLQALTAQTAALQELHAEQRARQLSRLHQPLQQQISADCLNSSNVSMPDIADGDSDDDCPPLANYHAPYFATASEAAVSGSTPPAAGESISVAAAVAAPVAVYSSSNGSSSAGCRVRDTAQKQPLQQQPCVQCGKLTKKRCRRCQAVYYCSEECQVMCFRNPEHRAQCDAAAAVLESTVV
jgi:MYND finger